MFSPSPAPRGFPLPPFERILLNHCLALSRSALIGVFLCQKGGWEAWRWRGVTGRRDGAGRRGLPSGGVCAQVWLPFREVNLQRRSITQQGGISYPGCAFREKLMPGNSKISGFLFSSPASSFLRSPLSLVMGMGLMKRLSFETCPRYGFCLTSFPTWVLRCRARVCVCVCAM